MDRHALVIGAETYGLAGAVHDATRMAELLQRRDFEVDRRIGGDATRDGIVEGYRALIGRVAAGDAAVVYYAGHGSFAYSSDPADPVRTVQAIIPVDHRPGSPDFRAITAWELGILLHRLTERTENVTVILDCCHSAQMSRVTAAREAVPRALPHPLLCGFRAHLAALEALYGKVRLDPVGNPWAVRLVACAQTECAWEYITADGGRAGVFTEALTAVLDEVGDAAISWAAVGGAVRTRVLRRFPAQRPDVEGPAQRRLFTLTADDRRDVVAIAASGGEIRIQTGAVLGTLVGDVYAAMPLGATSHDPAREIARLRVTEVAPVTATVIAAWQNGHRALPDDAVAVPVELAAPTHPVCVIAPGAEHDAIARALVGAPTVRLADPDEAPWAIATLRLVDRALTIEDAAGPIAPALRYPDELAAAVTRAARLGVAQRIRELVGDHGVSAGDLEISWGTVEDGRPRPLPDHGASVTVGTYLYVRIRHTGDAPRYVHVFNVGVRGDVALITKDLAAAGYRLDRNVPELVLGERDGTLEGMPIDWPLGLPADAPRTDSVFVFVTSQPVGLHPLETRDRTVRASPRDRGSKLQALLAQVQHGGMRDTRGPGAIEGFHVRHLSYRLHPPPAGADDVP